MSSRATVHSNHNMDMRKEKEKDLIYCLIGMVIYKVVNIEIITLL